VAVHKPAVVSIAVRNLSGLHFDDLDAAFPVFLKQVNSDLHLHWHHRLTKKWRAPSHGPHVPYVDRISQVKHGERWPNKRSVWRATIYDYPYQALKDDDLSYMPAAALEDLGYHFFESGVAHLIVFAALAEQSGLPWTLTFSHELLEALVDPTGDATIKTDEEDYELEICDPVQFQAYPIDGIWVSNFVTPDWFDTPGVLRKLGADTPRYDFAGSLVSARQRSLGGSRSLRIAGQDVTESLTWQGQKIKRGG
jgi:hypothetical protein